MLVIEDELHAEVQGHFPSHVDALVELRRRANIAWNEPPNLAPCTNWARCGRRYEIVEYSGDKASGEEICREPSLEVSAGAVQWLNT